MTPGLEELVAAYQKAERRLRATLLGDGLYSSGAVRGEEQREALSSQLRQLRMTFEALVADVGAGRSARRGAQCAGSASDPPREEGVGDGPAARFEPGVHRGCVQTRRFVPAWGGRDEGAKDSADRGSLAGTGKAWPSSAGASVNWVCNVPGEGSVVFVSAADAARQGLDTANAHAGQTFLRNFGEVCTVVQV